MTQIQWGIHDPDAFRRGYGQTKGIFDEFAASQKRNALEAAMRGYAMNPDDPNAVNALAQVDPATAIQVRQQQQTRQQAILEANREKIIAGAKIVRQLNPTDEASWQAARQAAANAGIDISEVPANFDPQYVQGLIATADALAPQSGSELMAVAPGTTVLDKQTGRPVYTNPGRPRYYPLAPGGRLVLDPSTDPSAVTSEATTASAGGGPEPGAVEEGYRFKGGDPARPENWEPVSGGPTVAPSGGFPR
jgi:hypothetical protein